MVSVDCGTKMGGIGAWSKQREYELKKKTYKAQNKTATLKYMAVFMFRKNYRSIIPAPSFRRFLYGTWSFHSHHIFPPVA